MDDPIIEHAVKVRDRVQGAATELRPPYLSREMDACACDDAAAMLQILETEVTRLRLLILHYRDGRMGRRDMVKATENWNGGTPEDVLAKCSAFESFLKQAD